MVSNHPALAWGRFETIKSKLFFAIWRENSLVRGGLRIRTASFRIFTLVLRCVEPFAHCFITLPALQSIYLPLLEAKIAFQMDPKGN